MALSLLFLYSLCLSVGLLLMYGAIRLSRVSMTARGRAAIMSGVILVALVAALPLLSGWHSRAVVTVAPTAETVETRLTAMTMPVSEPVVSPEAELSSPEAPAMRFDLWKLLCNVYLGGLCVALAQMIIAIVRILWIAVRAEHHDDFLLSSDDTPGPFSWGGWIVMGVSDYEAYGDMLYIHESAHRDGRHWLDLLLVNLLGCVAWYCPATRALRRELQSTHEYLADRAVLEAGFEARDYQMLLIAKASGRYPMGAVANCMANNSLKDRILMMQRSTPVSHQWLRTLAIVPAGMVMWAVASVPALASVASSMMPVKVDVIEVESVIPEVEEVEPAQLIDESVAEKTVETPEAPQEIVTEAIDEPVAEKSPEVDEPERQSVAIPVVSENVAKLLNDNKAFDTVETPPEYPGGIPALMKYLSENIRYPKECMQLGIDGRVIVRFIVKSDGSIGNIEVVHRADPQLDGEAVRLIRGIKGFTPGRMNGEAVNVWYTLPVVFRLSPKRAVAEYDEDVSVEVSRSEENGR